MRKAPRQQRSRATVAVILEAATRVLARRGWARSTTNEVAEVAGVSVGSVYQYFPNKLALAEALRQQHLEAVLAAWPDPDAPAADATPAQQVARLVDGLIAAHRAWPAMHRALLDEVPLAARAADSPFEAAYRRRLDALVAALAGEGAAEPWVLAATVEGVVHAAARRGELGSPALRQSLIALVNACLGLSPCCAAPPPPR